MGLGEEEGGRFPYLPCSRELDTMGEALDYCTTERGLAIRAKLGQLPGWYVV